jgi:hypothetical protein
MANINDFYSIDQVERIIAGDAAGTDYFGNSISVSGDVVVVGAWGETANTGAAYVFYKDKGGIDNWGQVKKITVGVASSRFGFSVSVSGDYLIVGAPIQVIATPPHAYIFYKDKDGTDNWGLVQTITGDPDVRLGNSVSILGDVAVVGANSYQAVGAVYIYYKDEGGIDNWGQKEKITETGTTNLGSSVSISENYMVAGDLGTNINRGEFFIYRKDQGGEDNWGKIKNVEGSVASGKLGTSVSVSDKYLVVSAIAEPGLGVNDGAIYIYDKDMGGNDNWGQVKKIITGVAAGSFGTSVSISEDYIVVGAPSENSGVVYIYNRNEGGHNNWGQVQKLETGVNPGQLGSWVSVSGDYIAAGAWAENIPAAWSGAAYIYQNTIDTSLLTDAPMGSSNIKVVQATDTPNFAYTPLVSYVNSSQLEILSQQYKKEWILNGIPLSLSLVKTAEANWDPSAGVEEVPLFSSLVFGTDQGRNNEYCYVINVIENTEPLQTDPTISVIDTPSQRTYSSKGTRLSASFIDNRYYYNVVRNQLVLGYIADYVKIEGMPLAKGNLGELLMYKTSYTMSDISFKNSISNADPSEAQERDLVDLQLGGSYLTAGRIEDKYYLIVSEV